MVRTMKGSIYRNCLQSRTSSLVALAASYQQLVKDSYDFMHLPLYKGYGRLDEVYYAFSLEVEALSSAVSMMEPASTLHRRLRTTASYFYDLHFAIEDARFVACKYIISSGQHPTELESGALRPESELGNLFVQITSKFDSLHEAIIAYKFKHVIDQPTSETASTNSSIKSKRLLDVKRTKNKYLLN